MSDFPQEFKDHLETGLTTVCRAWAIVRTDGAVLGFTDHDQDLEFEGITFKADTGLSAFALSQSTGLSVDNTEAVGALSDISVREDDIEAGRFDDAEVQSWLVNWQDPSVRWLQFRGYIGEIRRGAGAFNAELRGLSERLNRPQGKVYQKPCSAVLGDSTCGVDLQSPSYRIELFVEGVQDSRLFSWANFPDFSENWFSRGRLDVLDGPAAGLWGSIQTDKVEGASRNIKLRTSIRGTLEIGTRVGLTAGCDKRMGTCRKKFNNLVNFRGFPDLPGEDWILASPDSSNANNGKSRR